ncbi:MAG: polysaccharide deacetylase family protein, partial [Lachnospiraceae bacterium]
FLLGMQVEQYPKLVKRISEEGHLIGNHSYVHEQLTKLSNGKACEQINRTNDLIYHITGTYPTYVRPPYGEWKKNLDCELNMIEVFWDIDTLDWSCKNHSKIVNHVVTKIQENDIILMHDSYETTVTATMEIIDTLEKQGYEFVTVDELILE